MIVFTSTVCSPSDCSAVREYGMGVLWASTASGFRPSRRAVESLGPDVPHAVDNGAFGSWQSGYWFDEYAFLRTLSDVRRAGIMPRWIACPDLPTRGVESLYFSQAWMRRMPDVPWALVVQDGMGFGVVEDFAKRHAVRALFVGGSLEWKWETAERWVEVAGLLGIDCHIGRAGNPEDVDHCERIGADSCDSSSFVRNKSWEYAKGTVCHDLFTAAEAEKEQ